MIGKVNYGNAYNQMSETLKDSMVLHPHHTSREPISLTFLSQACDIALILGLSFSCLRDLMSPFTLFSYFSRSYSQVIYLWWS
jgi:hypothetical protein